MFLDKIRNIFCVSDTKVVSATNVARTGKRGDICVGNNVSSFARALKCSARNGRVLTHRGKSAKNNYEQLIVKYYAALLHGTRPSSFFIYC